MSQDFKLFLQNCRERLHHALEQNLPQVPSEASALYQAMYYSLFNGGKRVRPILVYASAFALCRDLSQAQMNDLDKVACSLECLHTYSLIHDDLPSMDDDNLRRGQPTCHIAFDEATAVLAGDALQSLAFELLTQLSTVPPATLILMIRTLSKAAGCQGMVAGQAVDLQATGKTLTLAELEQMHSLKTGALISACVTLGAQTVGADQTQLQALTAYAEFMGLAFQIQDDILDVVGDTAILGKQQGADIALDKPTYTSILGLNHSRERLQQLHQQAQKALSAFGEDADYLHMVSDYIINRHS